MTALFSLSIWTLMYTLDPYTPDYQDRLQSPGSITKSRTIMSSIRPQWLFNQLSLCSGVMVWPDTYGEEEIEITYNTSDEASWMKMSNILHAFLERSYSLAWAHWINIKGQSSKHDIWISASVSFLQHTTTPSSLEWTTVTARRANTSSRIPSLRLTTPSGRVPLCKACWEFAQALRTRPSATTAPCLVSSLKWTGWAPRRTSGA